MDVLCKCSCGHAVTLTRSGKPNTYLRGHDKRGKPKTAEQKAKQSIAMQGKPGPWKGKHLPVQARSLLSLAHSGKRLTDDHKRKISQSTLGRVVSEATLSKQRGRHPSPDTRKKMSLAQRGERGSNWKGGIASEAECIRSSAEYRYWRTSVFIRDGYTCQDCGAHTGNGRRVTLHAHHINSFAEYPEQRLDLDNGITVCQPCHDVRHGRGPK